MNNSTTANIWKTYPYKMGLLADDSSSLLNELKKNASLNITMICVNLLVAILHAGGLYLLIRVKIKPNNSTNNENMVFYTNTRLLIMLSASEMTVSLFLALQRISMLAKLSIVPYIFSSIYQLSVGFSLSTMYLITLNRLLSTVNPLWYRRYVTKVKFTLVAILVFLIVGGLVFGVSFTNMVFQYSSPTIWFIAWLTANLLNDFYFVFCVVTYVVIFITLSKSRRMSRSRNHSTNSSSQCILTTLKSRGYVTPFLITISHMLMVTGPLIATMVCWFTGCLVQASQVYYITFVLNNMSDALIYVFFDQQIRNHLMKMVCWRNDADI